MADNVQAGAAVGSGPTFATDEVSPGLHVPRSKMTWGADGTATDVSAAAPLPVVQTGTPALPTGAATEATLAAASAKLPAALGQAAMAASLSVTVASNQTAVPVSAASLPLPSGASTAANQATANASLATLAGAVSGTEVQVDVVSSALPTGAATAARQALPGTAGTPSTEVLSVQGVSGGTALPVSAAALPLPSGASTESTLAAASAKLPATLGQKAMAASMAVVLASDQASVPVAATLQAETTKVIGTVNVAAGQTIAATNAGTFATQESGAALTALQLIDDVVKAEDAAHVSGDAGIMPLAVRRDAASTMASADGDYTPLQVDATGALRVTGGGGGTQYQEDAVHASGDTGTMALAVRRDANTALVGADGDYAPLQVNADGSLKVAITAGAGSGGTSAADDSAFSVGSGSGTPIMGLADETTPDAVDEGDVGVVRMTLNRALHVNLRAADGTELAAGDQYAEDAVHASGDSLTMAGAVRRDTPTSGVSADGDNATLNVNSAGRLYTTATIDAALPAGTNNIGDVDIATMPAVAGAAAHDAAISGNPVRIAGRAMSADYTAVASGDTADLLTDLNGRLVVAPHALPENSLDGATAAITGTSDTQVIAAQGAGVRIYVTDLLVTNSHATVGTVVEIKSGTTVRYRGYAAPAGGGFCIHFAKPLRLTANEALNAANLTTASNTYVSASAYKGP